MTLQIPWNVYTGWDVRKLENKTNVSQRIEHAALPPWNHSALEKTWSKSKDDYFPNMRLKNPLLHSEADTEKQICSTPASSPWFSPVFCVSPSPKSLWSQNTSPVTFERSPGLFDSLDKLHHYGLIAFSWILTPRKASQLPLLLAGAPTQYLSCTQGPLLSRRSVTP